MLKTSVDDFYMRQAYRLAEQAFEEDEIPVGAVVVLGSQIIGKGYNQTVRLNDPTAHAEMLAITAACEHLGSRYLQECTLYVTLEPCVMCAGASYWAMLGRAVFGASDQKNGFERFGKSLFHPKTQFTTGCLANECADLMTRFFAKKRI